MPIDPTLRERVREHKEKEQLTVKQLEQAQNDFDRLLVELQDDPLWQQLVVQLRTRREMLIEQLASGDLPRKKELIAQGQIVELGFLMRLQSHGNQLKENRGEKKEMTDVTESGR